MAATVEILENTSGKRLFAKLLYTSSGADESDALKIDASALVIPLNGTTTIRRIFWSTNTLARGANVELKWDGAAKATIAHLTGSGTWDFAAAGLTIANTATTPNGDLLISTTGFASGDSYTVYLELRIK